MIFFEVVVLQRDLDNFHKKTILFKSTVVFLTAFNFWMKSKQNNRVVDINTEFDRL